MYFRSAAILAAFVWWLPLSLAAHAAQQYAIELSDGRRISGEIVSFQNDVYTLKTEAGKTIEVPESEIRDMRAADREPPPPPRPSPPAYLLREQPRDLRTRMVQDPRVLKTILSLRDDPDFREVLSDPEILQAVHEGDVETLVQNSRFMRLLDHPAIREIGQAVEK